VHAFQGTKWTVAGEVPGLAGGHHPSIAPYGMFATRTAPVQIACGSEKLWAAFAGEFRIDPATPGFGTNPERVANRDALIALIEGLLADLDAETVLARLDAAGVPAGKVRSLDDVYAWEQTRSQGLLIDVEHPTLGRLQLPGPPLRFFAPGPDGETETTRRDHAAPPVLGADSAAIRAEVADRPAEGGPAA
jgi:crotonobetainyl-CoA:carnitine CoA-transferase CaiB-like acyl-CoA transferase